MPGLILSEASMFLPFAIMFITSAPVRLYSDSLPGVRSVIEGMEGSGRVFNMASEARKAAIQTKSTQKNAR